MVQPSDHEIDRLLATPVGRRTLLLGGVRRALGLSSLLTMGCVGTLAAAMSGCVRAPGTARDQFIYIS
ncbi:MAG: M48 family peptidase, partial [Nitrospira sp.]|nr:M48 family peptidase [Nitrospira sp.]